MFWLAALTGCVVRSTVVTTPALDGTLELTWTVGAGGCEDAGVEEVEITAGGVTQTAPCADGAATMSLDPGSYTVELVGYDAGGDPRYAGEANASIASEQTTDTHVVLSALPASATLTWYFSNGRLCSANGVTTVSATLFDDEDYEVGQQDADCDGGELVFEDLQAGAYAAVLSAGDGGAPLFDGQAEVIVDKGDDVSVEVELVER